MLSITPSRGTEWLNLQSVIGGNGSEVIAVTNGAAIGFTAAKLNAAGVVAVFLRLDVGDIRWWADGTVPTPASGIPLLNTETLTLNITQAKNFNMIAQLAGGATAYVHYLSRVSTV